MKLHIAAALLARLRGLIGRQQEYSSDDVLLITPCHSIHTFFMRRPIDLAFIGRDGQVEKAVEQLEPRRLASCRCAIAVLERYSPCREQPLLDEGLPIAGQKPDRWFHVGQQLCLLAPSNEQPSLDEGLLAADKKPDRWFQVGQRLCLLAPSNELDFYEAHDGLVANDTGLDDGFEYAPALRFNTFRRGQEAKI